LSGTKSKLNTQLEPEFAYELGSFKCLLLIVHIPGRILFISVKKFDLNGNLHPRKNILLG